MNRLKVQVCARWRARVFQLFEVPRHASQTVLDVVTHIQRALDPTLAYRYACRVGMCGSCAMTVNGAASWTCRTHVDKVVKNDRLEIAPLRNLPVIRDLVTDMREFFDKWARAKGGFQGRRTRKDDFARVPPENEDRKQVDAGIECIGCGVCYSACDVVAWNPDYLGRGVESRLDFGQDERDSKQWNDARVAGDRLPCLSYAHELHRALPEADFSDRSDCRFEAEGHLGRNQGRALSFRTQTFLWVAQRASAAVLALCVLVHLATVIYAVRGGLTAAEILSRTQASVAWFAFYSVFVLAVVVHVPIGLRAVLGEWLGWRSASRDVVLLAIAAILAWMGMQAVLGSSVKNFARYTGSRE